MAKFGDAVKEIRRMKEDNRSFPMVMPAIVQAFEDALAEINVLRSEFERYKAEATKKEKFLLEQFKDTMATHAKNFEDKVQGCAKDILTLTAAVLSNTTDQKIILESLSDLTGIVEDLKKKLADLRDTKTNNNMREG